MSPLIIKTKRFLKLYDICSTTLDLCARFLQGVAAQKSITLPRITNKLMIAKQQRVRSSATHKSSLKTNRPL